MVFAAWTVRSCPAAAVRGSLRRALLTSPPLCTRTEEISERVLPQEDASENRSEVDTGLGKGTPGTRHTPVGWALHSGFAYQNAWVQKALGSGGGEP
ncbi:hypothetical protein H920_12741 [Fukomys damarensis]|uniref:Uncharacterized protein n=1 Tax=Fukomys damarensis TaxID=885580 RepID=A0A091D5S1_FUKDA|nr:hypothetical protein H920_12741 [Fukomys damarensis]